MTHIQRRIAAAKARCEKAFKGVEAGSWVWCCHHEARIERLTCPPQDRIDYIYRHKDEDEQVTRFNNFRPVKSNLPATFLEKAQFINAYGDETDILNELAARYKLARLHRKDVPRHTWNKGNIF